MQQKTETESRAMLLGSVATLARDLLIRNKKKDFQSVKNIKNYENEKKKKSKQVDFALNCC